MIMHSSFWSLFANSISLLSTLFFSVCCIIEEDIHIIGSQDILRCSNAQLEAVYKETFSAEVWIPLNENIESLKISLVRDTSSSEIAYNFCDGHSNMSFEKCQDYIINLISEVHFILYLRMVDSLVSFLNCHGVDISQVENHSAMYPRKIGFLHEVSSLSEIKTICEIGFNMGHSALCFLVANPHAKVLSFDMAHNTAEGVAFGAHAADFLSTIFPQRFFLVAGKSQQTVPSFASLAQESKCDLIYVDGGHEYEHVSVDFDNLVSMANKQGHILLADDVNFEGVNKAWTERIEQGIIQELYVIRDSEKWFQDPKGKWSACFSSKLQSISSLEEPSEAGGPPPTMTLIVPPEWEPGQWLQGECMGGTLTTMESAVAVGTFTFQKQS